MMSHEFVSTFIKFSSHSFHILDPRISTNMKHSSLNKSDIIFFDVMLHVWKKYFFKEFFWEVYFFWIWISNGKIMEFYLTVCLFIYQFNDARDISSLAQWANKYETRLIDLFIILLISCVFFLNFWGSFTSYVELWVDSCEWPLASGP